MTRLINVSLIACLFLCLMSCGSNDAPVVTLTAPVDGAVLTASDTLTISGTATDDTGVTSIILSSSTLSIDGQNLASSTDTEVPFNVGLTLDGVIAGTYDIIVTATDEDGDTGESQVSFDVQ